MADVFTWKFSEIKTRWRKDTGLSSTNDISDEDLGKRINDYYVNQFPNDAEVNEFDGFLEQATSATDSGEYALDTDIDRLDDPITVDRTQIKLYRDRELFFRMFPENEQFVTDPTVAVGETDAAKVKHSNFTYRIQDRAYSKDSSEVALTGSTVPANTYGAWSLKIDSDGDITVAAASDNETGYDTPRRALEALSLSDGDSCFMGYVTITSSSSFIPGTTLLSSVTATFTDGKFELRNTPEAILIYGTQLWARPRPNDIYEIKALSIAERPTAFADDDTVVQDTKWGPAIARGDALLFLDSVGNSGRVASLAKSTTYMFNSIRSDKIKTLLGCVVERRF